MFHEPQINRKKRDIRATAEGLLKRLILPREAGGNYDAGDGA